MTTKKVPVEPKLSKMDGGDLLASAPSGGYYVGVVQGGHVLWADFVAPSGERFAAIRGPLPKTPKRVPGRRSRQPRARAKAA